MCGIPLDLDRSEVLARALRVPQHLDEKKNRLKAAAFRPKAGTDDLSVMRRTHMGDDACKSKAKDIHRESYRGFAAITVAEVEATGASAHDSRAGQFCGHAHISQGKPAPGQDEPADPFLQDQYRKLAEAARVYLDPSPNEVAWAGAPIS